MARLAAGGITGAGSTTLPLSSLYTTAGARVRVREIGVFNTTTTSVSLRLVRLTTLGTRGTAWTTAATYGEDPATGLATASGTHTAGPTLTDLGYRTVLGAAIGSGMVWTFEDFHLTIPAVANAGIGIAVENGGGQVCQVYWSWTEG
jgi:hypothetical protein